MKCDLFSQHVTFRYNDQPAYETLTGGCVSIIIIMTFIGIFSTTLFKTVNKQFINFNLSKTDQQSPSYFATTLQKNFMFAIGLDNIDLNSGERYFDIYMEYRHYYGTTKDKITVPLMPCQKQPWQQRGYGLAYEKLKLKKWLCPLQGTQIQLQGKFSSDVFKFYKIAAKKCVPSSNPSRPCANSTTIESYLNSNEAFNFNFYFINTILNPGNEQYVTSYLEDVNYFPFSTTNGVNANLFISSYEIETDESLLPNEDVHVDEGGIVLDSAQVMNYQIRGTDYMKLFLRKSPINLSITRSFRKIDDTFSYIGGLFSTILVFFGLISLYNQLSYEIAITKNTFYYDKNDPFDGDHFNLLTFFGYLIYSLFEKFGIILPWPQYQRLDRFLEEGRKQLDIRLIMQKITYSEKLGLVVLNKSKHKALLLSEPFTLEQADEIRKDLNFYKNFRKKFFPKGESSQQVQQTLNNFNSNGQNLKTQHQLSINFSKKNSLGQQNVPFSEQFVVNQPKSLKSMDSDKIHQKKVQSQNENSEEEFNQLDAQIRDCLLQLQNQVLKDNQLARKIMQKIDPRIKKRYLGKAKIILRPLKCQPKKKINLQEDEDKEKDKDNVKVQKDQA